MLTKIITGCEQAVRRQEPYETCSQPRACPSSIRSWKSQAKKEKLGNRTETGGQDSPLKKGRPLRLLGLTAKDSDHVLDRNHEELVVMFQINRDGILGMEENLVVLT